MKPSKDNYASVEEGDRYLVAVGGTNDDDGDGDGGLRKEDQSSWSLCFASCTASMRSNESDSLLVNSRRPLPVKQGMQQQQKQQQFISFCHWSDVVFVNVLGFQQNPLVTNTPVIKSTNNDKEINKSDDYDCDGYNIKNNDDDDDDDEEGPSEVKNTAAADLRLSMLSNFSTAYNILSISMALKIMELNYKHTTAAGQSLSSSALIAGMILGQLVGGALGDVMGRHRAMTVVMFLQVLAAFCSAFSHPVHVQNYWSKNSNGSTLIQLSVYQVLAAWRFLLGLGAGGVYPLAATLTAESSQSEQDRAKAVALTFSFQGVAVIVVPLVSWIVTSLLGAGDSSWRVILGLGALPGTVLMARRLGNIHMYHHHQRKSKSNLNTQGSTLSAAEKNASVREQQRPSNRMVPVSVMDAIQQEPNLLRKLVGTGGCWLLFDILFYGNTLFQPVVLSKAFGPAETVTKAAQDILLLGLLALPGYFVSIAAVGKQSPCWIQIQGFFAMGCLYLTVGLLFEILSEHKAALLIIYGSTFFFSNYGPNSTTFMLPSMIFSKACRSTLNGVCAAMGKVGAFLGTIVFVQAANKYGQETVFLGCGVLSFVGCLMTYACVSPKMGVATEKEDDSINKDSDDPFCDEDDMMLRHRRQSQSAQPAGAADEEMQDLPATPNTVRMKYVVSKPSLLDFYSCSF